MDQHDPARQPRVRLSCLPTAKTLEPSSHCLPALAYSAWPTYLQYQVARLAYPAPYHLPCFTT